MCYNVSKTDPYLSSFHSGSLWLWTSRYQIGPSHGWTAQESCKVIIFCKIGILKRGWVLILEAVKVYNCLLVYRWKFMYLKCVEWCEDMIDHRGYAHNLSSCEIKHWPEKKSGLNGIGTHDLCDTGVGLYQLSYQANWELATLWYCNWIWP